MEREDFTKRLLKLFNEIPEDTDSIITCSIFRGDTKARDKYFSNDPSTEPNNEDINNRLKDIVWKMCFSSEQEYYDNTKETHYDLMDMLIKKHNIKGASFQSCLQLYKLMRLVRLQLNKLGECYAASENQEKKMWEKYIRLTAA